VAIVPKVAVSVAMSASMVDKIDREAGVQEISRAELIRIAVDEYFVRHRIK
jgi:metal-responsive CopG/Arc/MetJ family transcriptional regulator